MLLSFRPLILVVAGLVTSCGASPTTIRRHLEGDDEVCFEGYILDTFCINQGFFKDDEDAVPLMEPETHTFICMLNPPECRASGFEVLGDPEVEGGNYTRVAKLDTAGNTLIINLGLEVGASCEGCTGTTDAGLRAVVVGHIFDDTSDPPLMNVTKVGAAGTTTCDELRSDDTSDGVPHHHCATWNVCSTIIMVAGLWMMAAVW